jgi:hypothetical protein
MTREERKAALEALQREFERGNEQMAKNAKLVEKLAARGVIIPATELAPLERLFQGGNLAIHLTAAQLAERDRGRGQN